jgi:uncharacterized membrane protein (DUF106 family)
MTDSNINLSHAEDFNPLWIIFFIIFIFFLDLKNEVEILNLLGKKNIFLTDKKTFFYFVFHYRPHGCLVFEFVFECLSAHNVKQKESQHTFLKTYFMRDIGQV